MKESPSKLKKNEKVRKEHQVDYQIEVQDSDKTWSVRRYGLETLEEARQYLEKYNNNYLFPERMRIVEREWNSTLTIIEQ